MVKILRICWKSKQIGNFITSHAVKNLQTFFTVCYSEEARHELLSETSIEVEVLILASVFDYEKNKFMK